MFMVEFVVFFPSPQKWEGQTNCDFELNLSSLEAMQLCFIPSLDFHDV